MKTRVNGPSPAEFSPFGERRTDPRYRLASFTYVKVSDGNGGIATDASEGGLQVTTAQVLTAAEGLELSIQIDIGKNAHSIDVIGRTIWLSDSHKTAGIQFLSITADARRQIQDWIARDAGAAELALRRSASPQSSAPPSERLEKLFPPEAHGPPAAEIPQPSPPAPLHGSLFKSDNEPSALRDEPVLSAAPARSTTKRTAAIICTVIIVCFAAGVIAARLPVWKRSPSEATSASAAETQTPAPIAAPSATATPTPATSATAGGSSPLVPSRQPSIANRPAVPAPASTGVTKASAGDSNPSTGGTGAPAASDSQVVGNSLMVTPPAPGWGPALVFLPQEAVAASGSVAIGILRSAMVPPGSSSQARTERLEFGKIATPPPSVDLPQAVTGQNSTEIVRLRAVLDERGEIESLTPIHGPNDLIPLAENMVRQWTQAPARLNGRPIQSFEDITFSFRIGEQ